MTKREFRYFKKRRVDRFWNKLFNITSAYQLAYLKIQQLKSKMITPTEQLENYLKYAELELYKELNANK